MTPSSSTRRTRALDATGTSVTGQSQFLSGALPLDVTFDAAGNLYVADFSGEILKVTKVP